MVFKGKVKDGVVVLEDPKALPNGTVVRVEPEASAPEDVTPSNSSGDDDLEEPWKTLLKFAGTAKGLPSDMARNHDHYIHGTPKK